MSLDFFSWKWHDAEVVVRLWCSRDDHAGLCSSSDDCISRRWSSCDSQHAHAFFTHRSVCGPVRSSYSHKQDSHFLFELFLVAPSSCCLVCRYLTWFTRRRNRWDISSSRHGNVKNLISVLQILCIRLQHYLPGLQPSSSTYDSVYAHFHTLVLL